MAKYRLLAVLVLVLLMGCTFERYQFTGDPYTNHQRWIARRLAIEEAQCRDAIREFIQRQARGMQGY